MKRAQTTINERATILVGDVREKLRELPDASIHCVVTSPPYWGLRDYGTEPQVWGNWRGQLGLEPTIEMFVEHLVEVFREVWRVLRDDGTFWLNMGDCYAASNACDRRNVVGEGSPDKSCARPNRLSGRLKTKDLVGQPWRVAFALQADGWYLRKDIIWAKPNPMPESCRDRPTSSHEYIFLMTKRGRYFFDQEAVRENSIKGASGSRFDKGKTSTRDGGDRTQDGYRDCSGRNIRSVWTIPTQPFPEAHFATFPEALPERCIKAGTSERGCCPACGAPWVRVVERKPNPSKQSNTGMDLTGGAAKTANPQTSAGLHRNKGGVYAENKTTGWTPSCTCPAADPIPCTVLDPFLGSGTTALVAARLGRNAIGIELNEKYADMARKQLVIVRGGDSRRPKRVRIPSKRKRLPKRRPR